MKKMLFIATSLPTKLGGVRSLYFCMLAFSKCFEVHFIRLNIGGADIATIALPKFVKFREIRCNGAALDPLAFLLPLHSKNVLKIRGAQGEIQKYIDDKGIDSVFMHAMDVSFALRALKAKVKVANQIDSFARYYSSKRKALGTLFSAGMEILQTALYFFVERILISNFDLVSYVSATDINPNPAFSKKTFVISQSRDEPFKKTNLGNRGVDVVILGRWVHPPNRDGLARVAPLLGRIKGSISIIGPHLDKRLKFPPNVRVLGMVDDISKYMAGSKVCIIPVWYGAGLQTKVFDALRHGCIVVTTPFTKEAFDASGFHSSSIIASGDLVASANKALLGYSPSRANNAYSDYKKFYSLNMQMEHEYVRRVCAIAGLKAN